MRHIVVREKEDVRRVSVLNMLDLRAWRWRIDEGWRVGDVGLGQSKRDVIVRIDMDWPPTALATLR
jgi:hypothetical protein